MRRFRKSLVSTLILVLALFAFQAPAAADGFSAPEHGPLARSFFERTTQALTDLAGLLGGKLADFFSNDGANIETDP